jgi:hypothetical protein
MARMQGLEFWYWWLTIYVSLFSFGVTYDGVVVSDYAMIIVYDSPSIPTEEIFKKEIDICNLMFCVRWDIDNLVVCYIL